MLHEPDAVDGSFCHLGSYVGMLQSVAFTQNDLQPVEYLLARHVRLPISYLGSRYAAKLCTYGCFIGLVHGRCGHM